jgi:hypothetical protein
MRYYCTNFDINYVAHAKSLHHSLLLHGGEFTLLMFCMDDDSYKHLDELKLQNARLIHYNELEKFIPELLIAKANRTRVEYFYTCSSAISYFTLQNYKEADIVTYLDADLFFFNSPEPVFEEFGNSSVGIIEHKFKFFAERSLRYGKYNVGWINFRNDENGLACVTDWKNDCIEWCYQKIEANRYADQKYLDAWPAKYKGVHEFKHKGANLGPWNLPNYKLSKVDGKVYVDEQPLIFYHFANLKQINHNLFKTDLSRSFIKTTGVLKEDIYIPYIKELIKNTSPNKIFSAKKDIHIQGINILMANLSRYIRQLILPDWIRMD